MSLTAGVSVPIKVEYYENLVGAAVVLYAKGAVAETYVPPTWLSATAPGLPPGWSLSADLDGELAYSAATVTNASVALVDSSGATHTYAWTGSAYKPPPGEDGVLAKAADGTLTLHEDNGVSYVFDTSGHLLSATSGVDDRRPAAPTYTWTGTPSRLDRIGDPVSGRSIVLRYGGDSSCPGSPPPGFDAAAPQGMLCSLSYWDTTTTKLWYSAAQLGRIEDPGGEVTDFAYTSGLLTKIRDPLAADWVAADPANRNNDTTRTVVAYSGGRVASVTLPEPLPAKPRPASTYRYVSATETQRDTAGLAQPTGFARRVTFDTDRRVLTDTDATARTSSSQWSAKDELAARTDPAGRRSTTLYDSASRPTSHYGPAPTESFGPDNQPKDATARRVVARTDTTYDGGISGMAATYWANRDLAGPPKLHKTVPAVAFEWGGGSPDPLIPADNH